MHAQLLPAAGGRYTHDGYTHCGRFTGCFSLADVRVVDLCLHLFEASLPGCLEGFPLLHGLVSRVKARPRIAAYLASERYACADTCVYHSLPPFPPSPLTHFLTSCFLASLLPYYDLLTSHHPCRYASTDKFSALA